MQPSRRRPGAGAGRGGNVIALIDLDEGFRLMVNMADFQPDEVAIGLRVRIGFRQAGEGIHLPEARRPETGLHGRTAP